MTARLCSAAECNRPHVARGLCGTHYMQAKRRGDIPPDNRTTEERFWAKVDKDGPNGCWLWTGAIAGFSEYTEGYGYFRKDGRSQRAHRVAFEYANGPVPVGAVLDHLCRVPLCVNPVHLEAVTQRENMRRSAPATRAACIHGHPRTPENIYTDKRGRRDCLVCRRDRSKKAA